MVLKRPSSVDVTWSSYVMEMTVESWTVFGVFMALIWFLLPFVANVSERENTDSKLDISESMLIVAGSFLGNGKNHLIILKNHIRQ